MFFLTFSMQITAFCVFSIYIWPNLITILQRKISSGADERCVVMQFFVFLSLLSFN